VAGKAAVKSSTKSSNEPWRFALSWRIFTSALRTVDGSYCGIFAGRSR
jgi:hypothetical protein